jgi:hypothetical protein
MDETSQTDQTGRIDPKRLALVLGTSGLLHTQPSQALRPLLTEVLKELDEQEMLCRFVMTRTWAQHVVFLRRQQRRSISTEAARDAVEEAKEDMKSAWPALLESMQAFAEHMYLCGVNKKKV